MEKVVHKSDSRGHANHGWLDTHHSFSFGSWYNPERMRFGLLRVLNDDRVAAGRGFGAHPHENMEIVSIPLKGALRHEDSTGKKAVIRENDVQIMSAGKGITHSEYNDSDEEEVRFLQVWVFPKEKNIDPRYEQKTFPPKDRTNQLQVVVSPEHEEAIWINQEAYFYLGKFEGGQKLSHRINQSGHGAYLFVIEGSLLVAGEELTTRDAIGIWKTEEINIEVKQDAELLLIEVPMN